METEVSTVLEILATRQDQASSRGATSSIFPFEDPVVASTVCSTLAKDSAAAANSCRTMMSCINEKIVVFQHFHEELMEKAHARRVSAAAGNFYSELARRYEVIIAYLREEKEIIEEAVRCAKESENKTEDIRKILQGVIKEADKKRKLRVAYAYCKKAARSYIEGLKCEYYSLHIARRLWKDFLKDVSLMNCLKLSKGIIQRRKDRSITVVNVILLFVGAIVLASPFYFTTSSECFYFVLIAGILKLVFSLTYCSTELYTCIKSRREASNEIFGIINETDGNSAAKIDKNWLKLLKDVAARLRSLERIFENNPTFDSSTDSTLGAPSLEDTL